MGVARDDQVERSRNEPGGVGDLPGHSAVTLLDPTGVRRQDDQVGAFRLEPSRQLVDHEGDLEEFERLDVLRQRGDGRKRSRGPDDRDPQPRTLEPGVRHGPLRPLPRGLLEDIRRQEGVRGLAKPGPQRVDAPVELVVPDRRRVHA